VPVWHEQTQDLVAEGKVRMAGIIEEQHPDRCRLFMQWKQMSWPVMVDALDQLGVKGVPLHLLIDEGGIVRGMPRPRGPQDIRAAVEGFVGSAPAEPAGARDGGRYPSGAQAVRVPDLEALRAQADAGERGAILRCADALSVWGCPADLDEAVDLYPLALEDEETGAAHFRLGSSLLKRAESARRAPGDFGGAIGHFRRALSADPDQYIWRRRIQQYGPRLDKPYPFYDWVDEARRAIRARGEEPAELGAEPRGAELAAPLRGAFPAADPGAIQASERESAGIALDGRGLVTAEVAVVPHTGKGERCARIHILLAPDADLGVHWSNESEPPVLWIEASDGWQVDPRRIELPNAAGGATSAEARRAEIEVRAPPGAAAPPTLRARVLYSVCDLATGECLVLRRDLDIDVELPADGR